MALLVVVGVMRYWGEDRGCEDLKYCNTTQHRDSNLIYIHTPVRSST
jgi:hypothetical protein